MKRYFLLLTGALLLLALTTGCSPRLLNTQGESLTWPRPDPAVSIPKDFQNGYQFPIWVGPSHETQVQINPGQIHTFVCKSKREQDWWVSWPRTKGTNETLEHTDFTRVGLFPGDLVVLDESFLRGLVAVPIVIFNNSVERETAHFKDGQKNDVSIPFGESAEIMVIPGDYEYWWWSETTVGNTPYWQGQQMTGRDIVPVSKDKYYNGHYVAWKWSIDRLHW